MACVSYALMTYFFTKTLYGNTKLTMQFQTNMYLYQSFHVQT